MLPLIADVSELSEQVHLTPELLFRISRCSSLFYREIQRTKKDGSIRIIHCPSVPTRAAQTWILRRILETVPLEDSATGFRTGINILTNALRHRDNPFMMCLDVRDFFPSVGHFRVYAVYRELGYSPHVSHVLTSICTFNGRLPQGGVTSPALSNIVCRSLDRRILGYAIRHSLSYTRYADDITLSGNDPKTLWRAKRTVARILAEEGFTLNETKTRILGPGARRLVTGIVIGDLPNGGKSVGVGRDVRRRVRAMIHHSRRACLIEENPGQLDRKIAGWLAHLRSVDVAGREQLDRYMTKMVTPAAIAPAQSDHGAPGEPLQSDPD